MLQALLLGLTATLATPQPAITDYPTPQEAINAHPGAMLYVPPGTHRIKGTLFLKGDGGGLYGPGTIEQTNPDSTIVTVEKASLVRLEGITLTRSPGDEPAGGPGLFIHQSRLVEVRGVRVVDHHAREAAIEIRDSDQITDFGYGHEYWNWGGRHNGNGGYGIFLMDKQLEENPNLSDILIEGNAVYDSGRDGVLVDGELVREGPRYQYALCIRYTPDSPHFPENVIIGQNLFHAGRDGVSNQELPLAGK